MKDLLPIEGIYERDLDMLFLEEFQVNAGFLLWVISELGLPPFLGEIEAWHSVSDFNLGESDLLARYGSEEGKVLLLIENKIDAMLQDKQQERYEARGRMYQQKGECARYFCILLAPGKYIEQQNDFEWCLPYEKVEAWWQQQADARSLFRARLVRIGIEKQRRGYQPVNDERVQRFWHAYFHLLEDMDIGLTMNKPGIVPSNSDWPVLSNRKLKKARIQILHKLARGHIDAQLNGATAEKAAEIQPILPEGYTLEKTGKSFSIRMETFPLNRFSDFAGQRDKAREALQKAGELAQWIGRSLV